MGPLTAKHATPGWSVAPFVAYLLLIALLPLVVSRFWEHNRNKLALALVAAVPVVVYLFTASRASAAEVLVETGCDYAAFIALLGALFAISGGICLRGSLTGTPLVNTVLLAVGAVLASFIGTTGASALLIRPLLRANERRLRKTHVVVFFIFIVANGAGLLTPLGDPPLFLGFLRGVPFAWTFRLSSVWAFVMGVLLALFAIIDSVAFELERRRGSALAVLARSEPSDPLRLDGSLNILFLLGVVGVVFASGTFGKSVIPNAHLRSLVQAATMASFAAMSWFTTPHRVRSANHFSWAPMVEVAVIFLGVFVTMIPALSFLEERGTTLGITRPVHFFWAAGALSSVLDNAPTYLTFASLAVGVANGGSGVMSSADLGALASHPTGQHLLAAISAGAVLMGAITYIGNGPNFMVKAIADQHHVRTPSFFGYIVWSGAILVPLFGLVAFLFF